MPDTGLPWEIPYAAPADLVRDWPALSEDVADAVAAGLSAAGNPGIGSNVVSTETTTTFTTSSGTFVLVTPLTVTITPTSATSKILVIASFAMGQGNVARNSFCALARGSTLIAADATSGAGLFYQNFTGSAGLALNYALTALDSPATTSPVTYNVMGKASGSSPTATFNRSGDGGSTFGGVITAIEVAA